jgi:hypothetical protein
VLEKTYATLRANDSEVPGMPDIYFTSDRFPRCLAPVGTTNNAQARTK